MEERVARLETTDDLEALLEALPPEIIERVREVGAREDLLHDVALQDADLGGDALAVDLDRVLQHQVAGG